MKENPRQVMNSPHHPATGGRHEATLKKWSACEALSPVEGAALTQFSLILCPVLNPATRVAAPEPPAAPNCQEQHVNAHCS